MEKIDRPYIICHMVMSLDGKITGAYMDSSAAEYSFEEYERINKFYAPQAWMNGRITVDENFTFNAVPKLEKDVLSVQHVDYAATTDAANYLVAVDPSGRLGWQQNYVEYAGRPRAHVIELLTDKVSDAYLVYLRQHKISYIFAGAEELDMALAVSKLKKLWGIERLKVSGGGILNWSFASAGLIDELSIVLAPVADGDANTPALFKRTDAMPFNGSVSFKLKSAEPVSGGCVWLRYVADRD